MTKIAVVIDMQNDFITGALGSEDAELIVDRIDKELTTDKYDDVYFTMDTHYKDYPDTLEGKSIPVHCIRETEGWEIVPALKQYAENAHIVEKETFGSQALADLLYDEWVEEEDIELTLMGVCTDICVVSNALILRAALPDVKIRVMEDCCAGTTKANHDAAIAVMKSNLIEVL